MRGWNFDGGRELAEPIPVSTLVERPFPFQKMTFSKKEGVYAGSAWACVLPASSPFLFQRKDFLGKGKGRSTIVDTGMG